MRILVVAGCLLGRAAAALADPAVIADQTFADADWSIVPFTVGAGGTVGATQSGDGNPAPGRTVTITVNAAPSPAEFSAVDSVHLFAGLTYDPQTRGPIANVDYFEDALLVQGFGDGQATGIALRQGGNVYFRQIGTTPDLVWTTKQATGVPASGFVRIFQGGTDTGAHPDFSAAGGLIEFGFTRRNSTAVGANGYTIVAAIDNWTVLVNPPCADSSECVYAGGCFAGACVAGACKATPTCVPDDDPCTQDTCDAGTCAHTPIACDDGDPCTTDSCGPGGCTATAADCDDGVPCTIDACSAGTCTHTTGFESIESAIDGLLALLESPPCAGDGLAAKVRKKLVKKVGKARKKLASADAATKAKIVARLVGGAGRLLDAASTVLAKATAGDVVSPACASVLGTFLTSLATCVDGL